jgi:hypothetical protein
MISDYQKHKIDEYVTLLYGFYNDCSKGYFKGGDFPNELTEESLSYLNSTLNLEQIVGVDKQFVLNAILSKPDKQHFAKYLLRTHGIRLEVNNSNNQFQSNFQLLFHLSSKEKGGLYARWELIDLYERGYKNTNSDGIFLSDFYKTAITSEDTFLQWCAARFCFKLNDSKKIMLAHNNANVLFTILSFKLNKPVGFNYPNLLAIANTALTSYRTNGDIILSAMRHYGVYANTKARDKKGVFATKEQDFHQYKPIQDLEFREIIFQIFPELQESTK